MLNWNIEFSPSHLFSFHPFPAAGFGLTKKILTSFPRPFSPDMLNMNARGRLVCNGLHETKSKQFHMTRSVQKQRAVQNKMPAQSQQRRVCHNFPYKLSIIKINTEHNTISCKYPGPQSNKEDNKTGSSPEQESVWTGPPPPPNALLSFQAGTTKRVTL